MLEIPVLQTKALSLIVKDCITNYLYKTKQMIVDKVELNESEQRELDLFMEEFKQSSGMTTEELISRLDAIPFDEFMKKLDKRLETI